MSAANASLLNALVLIVVGSLGYLLPEEPSKTALIPVVFGVVIGAMNPGVRASNKVVAHVAVGVTLLILIALVTPLRGALGREDTGAVVRVSLMLLSTAVAMVAFVKSFIDVRRERKAAESAAEAE